MVRPDLGDLPVVLPPPGFALRLYHSGDDETWKRIHDEAERFHAVSLALFWREFGEAEAELPRRQLFLCDPEGREVGTATAWFTDDYRGRPWGRIHWVAVSEKHQGRGLGRALVSAVCQRFKELGHTRAYLTTESVRVPAINLYLSFGFRPELKHDGDRREWETLRGRGVRLDGPPKEGASRP
jgi:GNAT superfamily N-acetyltransferase